MNYKVFRSAVLELLEEDKEWEVETDWGEESCGSSPGSLSGTGADAESVDDFIELEQEKGAIYEFMSVSVGKLFLFYQDEGWDAVVRELERHTRRGRNSLGRNRGIDYTFTNRTLYEMCCHQPGTMEELRALYGVGEKNSQEYGQSFLEEILEFKSGIMK